MLVCNCADFYFFTLKSEKKAFFQVFLKKIKKIVKKLYIKIIIYSGFHNYFKFTDKRRTPMKNLKNYVQADMNTMKVEVR